MQSGGMRTRHSVTMWVGSRGDHLLCVVAGGCALFWLVGVLAVGLGNFADQWAKPHCPSGQAQHTPQSQHYCVWHCDGIDEQAAGGQGATLANLDSGSVWKEFISIPYSALVHAQIVPRGPPTRFA